MENNKQKCENRKGEFIVPPEPHFKEGFNVPPEVQIRSSMDIPPQEIKKTKK